LSVRDPSLTLTQFCARLKTVHVILQSIRNTSIAPTCDSLGCKDCCANTNSLIYLLTYLLTYSASHVLVASAHGKVCDNAHLSYSITNCHLSGSEKSVVLVGPLTFSHIYM